MIWLKYLVFALLARTCLCNHNHLNANGGEESHHLLKSNVSRWKHVDMLSSEKKKDKTKALVFLSITSAPKHVTLRQSARNTWLMPCVSSPICMYRFFIDATSQNITEALSAEQAKHGDLVFRDTCPYMLSRHPLHVNYGNANVKDKTRAVETSPGSGVFVRTPTVDVSADPTLADYPLRRMYKVDWKVCFLKWIHAQVS